MISLVLFVSLAFLAMGVAFYSHVMYSETVIP